MHDLHRDRGKQHKVQSPGCDLQDHESDDGFSEARLTSKSGAGDRDQHPGGNGYGGVQDPETKERGRRR